jgi:hypothetical protein
MPSNYGGTYGGQSHNNQFMYLPPYGVGSPGSQTVGGGGGVPEPFFRDLLDARRSMWRRTPDAEYPDGYLGTIVSRRGDRVLDSLKSRVNQRQYQRGVHKGERIDPGDYYWPAKFNPDLGLELEARGEKFSPIGIDMPTEVTREMVLPAKGALMQQTLNPKRQAQLRMLAPSYRW